MKSSIKIIKRKRNERSNDSQTGETEKAIQRDPREIANTVKSWIAELRQRRHAQAQTLAKLPD